MSFAHAVAGQIRQIQRSAEPAELRWPLNNQAPPLTVRRRRGGSNLPNLNPPPPNAYPPPPGANPPPTSVYPQLVPGAKVAGDNTKWAVGLGIAALFCCGPLTGVPGIFLAKKDMDEIAAGRAPHLDEGWAKGAFYLNIIALSLFVLGICLFSGLAGLRRF